MNATRSFIAVTCLAVVSACSTVMAPSQSDFLIGYSALSRGSDGAASMRSAAAIDPARVTIGDIEWRTPTSTSVSDDERRLLLRELSDELAARVRELPAAPGGRPAVLRAAIMH